MSYTIRVEVSMLHELLLSLTAYLSPKNQRTLDLGTGWAAQVKEGLTPGLAARLAAYGEEPPALGLLTLLIMQSPHQDVDSFLTWFGALSPGEIYERVAPHQRSDAPALPPDLGGMRDDLASLLRLWHEEYFQRLDPAILKQIQLDGADKHSLIGTLPPVKLLEQATGGLVVEPEAGLTQVILIPQYHYRPVILVNLFRSFTLYYYPLADMPTAPDQPSPRLLRVARALGDESRLRILRFVAGEPKSFTEIVKFTGLALSTVHHHMLALRAAGLVRVHDSGLTPGQNARYTFRPTALADLNIRLATFIQGD